MAELQSIRGFSGKVTAQPTEIKRRVQNILTHLDEYIADGQAKVANLVASQNDRTRIDQDIVDNNQSATHALAWFKAYSESLRGVLEYMQDKMSAGTFSDHEVLLVQTAVQKYVSEMMYGIRSGPMDIVRIEDMGLGDTTVDALRRMGDIKFFLDRDRQRAVEMQLSASLYDQIADDKPLLGESTLPTRAQDILKHVDAFLEKHPDLEDVVNSWHNDGELINPEMIQDMADAGFFSLTIPKEYGGEGLGTLEMAAVTSALGEKSLVLASVATRFEMAAHAILAGGSEAQKQNFLPKIANAEIMPAVLYSEPDAGSDLGALQTSATPLNGQDIYDVHGDKTWAGLAGYANRLLILSRTDPDSVGSKGLSLLFAEKSPDPQGRHFTDPGLSGAMLDPEGYRGQGAFHLNFNGFTVPFDDRIGEEGLGFKYVMRALEAARIQTGARAAGVAKSALNEALSFAALRDQKKPLTEFSSISRRLANMAADSFVAEIAAYRAAASFDNNGGARADMEAGISKMLCGHIGENVARAAQELHGNTGYREGSNISRIAADSRALGVFEGAKAVQANIIAGSMLRTEMQGRMPAAVLPDADGQHLSAES